MSSQVHKESLNHIRMLILMAMFGAMMFISQKLMEFLPNIHLLATIIAVITIVYRRWALIAVLIYVFMSGLFGGFGVWWVPYIYLWPMLWLLLMLVPAKTKKNLSIPISAGICTLHGFLFGVLYAPAQALFFHLNFEQTIAWIASGLYFDLLHGIGNAVLSLLIYPLVRLLFVLEKRSLLK